MSTRNRLDLLARTLDRMISVGITSSNGKAELARAVPPRAESNHEKETPISRHKTERRNRVSTFFQFGVTADVALNDELTAIENQLTAANRAAIYRLNTLVDREPASTSYVQNLLSRLHGDNADFKSYRHRRADYSSEMPKETKETAVSGGCLTVSDIDSQTSRVRINK